MTITKPNQLTDTAVLLERAVFVLYAYHKQNGGHVQPKFVEGQDFSKVVKLTAVAAIS